MHNFQYLLVASLLCLVSFASAGSNEASKTWLAENSKNKGVVTLPSGLQYKVLRKGKGKYHPKADSSCSCHYAGTLIDGTKFDSSYDRGSPTSFAPDEVISGWTEAMQLMVEGDKWEMYIPSELGYGDGGSPPKIRGGDALIFKMEILKIEGGKVPATATTRQNSQRTGLRFDRLLVAVLAVGCAFVGMRWFRRVGRSRR